MSRMCHRLPIIDKAKNEVKQPIKNIPIGVVVGIDDTFDKEADLISDGKTTIEAEVEILKIARKTDTIVAWTHIERQLLRIMMLEELTTDLEENTFPGEERMKVMLLVKLLI